MIAAAASSTVSNGDVIGLAAAGIGILYWAGKGVGRTEDEDIFESRLIRNPRAGLLRVFALSEQYVVAVWNMRTCMIVLLL